MPESLRVLAMQIVKMKARQPNQSSEYRMNRVSNSIPNGADVGRCTNPLIYCIVHSTSRHGAYDISPLSTSGGAAAGWRTVGRIATNARSVRVNAIIVGIIGYLLRYEFGACCLCCLRKNEDVNTTIASLDPHLSREKKQTENLQHRRHDDDTGV